MSTSNLIVALLLAGAVAAFAADELCSVTHGASDCGKANSDVGSRKLLGAGSKSKSPLRTCNSTCDALSYEAAVNISYVGSKVTLSFKVAKRPAKFVEATKQDAPACDIGKPSKFRLYTNVPLFDMNVTATNGKGDVVPEVTNTSITVPIGRPSKNTPESVSITLLVDPKAPKILAALIDQLLGVLKSVESVVGNETITTHYISYDILGKLASPVCTSSVHVRKDAQDSLAPAFGGYGSSGGSSCNSIYAGSCQEAASRCGVPMSYSFTSANSYCCSGPKPCSYICCASLWGRR